MNSLSLIPPKFGAMILTPYKDEANQLHTSAVITNTAFDDLKGLHRGDVYLDMGDTVPSDAKYKSLLQLDGIIGPLTKLADANAARRDGVNLIKMDNPEQFRGLVKSLAHFLQSHQGLHVYSHELKAWVKPDITATDLKEAIDDLSKNLVGAFQAFSPNYEAGFLKLIDRRELGDPEFGSFDLETRAKEALKPE